MSAALRSSSLDSSLSQALRPYWEGEGRGEGALDVGNGDEGTVSSALLFDAKTPVLNSGCVSLFLATAVTCRSSSLLALSSFLGSRVKDLRDFTKGDDSPLGTVESLLGKGCCLVEAGLVDNDGESGGCCWIAAFKTHDAEERGTGLSASATACETEVVAGLEVVVMLEVLEREGGLAEPVVFGLEVEMVGPFALEEDEPNGDDETADKSKTLLVLGSVEWYSNMEASEEDCFLGLWPPWSIFGESGARLFWCCRFEKEFLEKRDFPILRRVAKEAFEALEWAECTETASSSMMDFDLPRRTTSPSDFTSTLEEVKPSKVEGAIEDRRELEPPNIPPFLEKLKV